MLGSTQQHPLGKPQQQLQQQQPQVTSLQCPPTKKNPTPLIDCFWVSTSWPAALCTWEILLAICGGLIPSCARSPEFRSGAAPSLRALCARPCWLLAHHHRARIPQSISQPRRAHAPTGHPVPPSPIGHNQTRRHSRAKRRSSRLIQTQMVSDRGSLQGQRVTLPAGNQDTAFQVCFKYSSPHAHPGLSFRDQSSSFWKQHVCLQSATGAQT